MPGFAQLCSHFITGILIATGDHHFGTLFSESEGDSLADTLC